MAIIKVEKDNVMLSIEEEDFNQYETRGYNKLGAAKKVASKDLEKEVSKLTKANEDLKVKYETLETEKAELAKANEELTKNIAELEKKVK